MFRYRINAVCGEITSSFVFVVRLVVCQSYLCRVVGIVHVSMLPRRVSGNVFAGRTVGESNGPWSTTIRGLCFLPSVRRSGHVSHPPRFLRLCLVVFNSTSFPRICHNKTLWFNLYSSSPSTHSSPEMRWTISNWSALYFTLQTDFTIHEVYLNEHSHSLGIWIISWLKHWGCCNNIEAMIPIGHN